MTVTTRSGSAKLYWAQKQADHIISLFFSYTERKQQKRKRQKKKRGSLTPALANLSVLVLGAGAGGDLIIGRGMGNGLAAHLQ